MSIRPRFIASALFVTASFAASPSSAAWQNGVNYGGSGPTMDLFTPDKVDASPAIVVALHYCGGNSGAAHGWFEGAASMYGFLIIAGDAPNNCWNAQPQRSSDAAAIVKMVEYVVREKQADASKVFVAGASSGASMTNVLLATYPEVFAGGSVLAGVPAGAWPQGDTQCGFCGQQPNTSKSAQQWGDIVRNASSSFTGARPKVQLWHGTSDEYLLFGYFGEEVEQWTNVLGVSDATDSEFKTSRDTWARKSYKNGSGDVVLETNVAQGAPHDLTGRGLWPDVVRFFGLDRDTPPGASGAGGSGGSGGASPGGSGGSGGALPSAGTGGAPFAPGGASSVGGASSGVAGALPLAGSPSSGLGGGGNAGLPVGSAGTVSAGSPSAAAGALASAGAPSGLAGTSSTPPASSASNDEGGGCSLAPLAPASTMARDGLGFLGLGAAGLWLFTRRSRRSR